MPPEVQEKTPGVYVRAENEQPHELDMLWSNTRSYPREERSPLVSFIAGVLVGGILTAAVFLLFLNQPKIQTGGANQITAPISEDIDASQTQSATKSASGSTTAAGTSAPAGGTSYTVVSGDTLGRISEKVYGSSAPKYVDKIQRANGMRTPDDLQIDQKLVIPPKDY